MKSKITQDQFEDVQFADDKIVVEKTHYFSRGVEVKSLYVFESITDKEAKEIYERRTDWESVQYFKIK